VTRWQICLTESIDMLITDSDATDKMIAPFLEKKIEVRRV
jgi:hypothetical protein